MQNKLSYLVFFTSMICASATLAQSASEQLTKIEGETLLLKAREKQLEVQAAIIAKQNDIATKRKINEELSLPNAASAGDPMIRSVEGIGANMYASLLMANGNVVDAQAGDTLPNGMKVVSVKANEVIVQGSGKKRRTVRLAAAPQQAPAASGMPIGLLPPLPVLAPRGGLK